MRIFDCTTFYNENLILNVRFNILDPYVDRFVICEAGYSHSGQKKKFNFDINNFSKFKHKIIYLKIENEPDNLKYIYKNDKKIEPVESAKPNAIKRIAHQRNHLREGILDATDDDLILYSDNDEIPNLELHDITKEKSKIIIFEQDLYYFKFNLLCDRIKWYGTRAIKKKN